MQRSEASCAYVMQLELLSLPPHKHLHNKVPLLHLNLQPLPKAVAIHLQDEFEEEDLGREGILGRKPAFH